MGHGEFGVVYEASATNISKNIRVQTVAVKMLHRSKNADPRVFVQEAVCEDRSSVILLRDSTLCYRYDCGRLRTRM